MYLEEIESQCMANACQTAAKFSRATAAMISF
jgi:hypothetical protein